MSNQQHYLLTRINSLPNEIKSKILNYYYKPLPREIKQELITYYNIIKLSINQKRYLKYSLASLLTKPDINDYLITINYPNKYILINKEIFSVSNKQEKLELLLNINDCFHIFFKLLKSAYFGPSLLRTYRFPNKYYLDYIETNFLN